MVRECQGNLLRSTACALVNPVNCVGVMGAGLAKQFKGKYPQNFSSYEAACRRGVVLPGRMFVVALEGRYIVNFPTKRHWKNASCLWDIEKGLQSLVVWSLAKDVPSLALPALGCGLGGLSWPTVRALIYEAFEPFPAVAVELYSPQTSGLNGGSQ